MITPWGGGFQRKSQAFAGQGVDGGITWSAELTGSLQFNIGREIYVAFTGLCFTVALDFRRNRRQLLLDRSMSLGLEAEGAAMRPGRENRPKCYHCANAQECLGIRRVRDRPAAVLLIALGPGPDNS